MGAPATHRPVPLNDELLVSASRLPNIQEQVTISLRFYLLQAYRYDIAHKVEQIYATVPRPYLQKDAAWVPVKPPV